MKARLLLAVAFMALLPPVVFYSLPARADHTDGHIYDWKPGNGHAFALQQKLVSGQTLTVCSNDLPSSTATAVSRWNAAVAAGLVYQSCPADVTVIVDSQQSFNDICGLTNPPQHMCTNPTDATGDPTYSVVVPITIRANPTLFPGTYADGSDHASRDITHEFGHVFGHDEYSGCPNGATVMDTTEACWYTAPQALDLTNFHNAYHIDAVASPGGSSPSSGIVSLTWDPSNVHNEAFFVVWWMNPSTGQWDYLPGQGGAWIVSANSGFTQFGGQPAGTQEYGIWGYGYADHTDGPYGGGVTQIVFVQGAGSPPPAPSAVDGGFDFFGNPAAVLLCWNPSAGATSYDFLFMAWNNGAMYNQVFSNVSTTTCASKIGAGATLSPSDWEHAAVRACNAYGCSGWVDMTNPWQFWTFVPCSDTSGLSCSGDNDPNPNPHSH